MRSNLRWPLLLVLILAGSHRHFSAVTPTGDQQASKSPQVSDQQAKGRIGGDRPGRPVEIEALVDSARNAPPEFAADALLRIAQSDRIKQSAWKRELLEEAFRWGAHSSSPIRRRALAGSLTDTRSGYLAKALDLNLDALSLQCRAVKAMLSVDRGKARELFGEIRIHQLPPLNCEEPLVYDFSDFHETLREIVQSGFTAKEKSLNDHIHFAESFLMDLFSPTQVAPAADAIASLSLSPPQLEVLLRAFTLGVARVSPDDRSFSYSMRGNSVVKEVGRLINTSKKQGVLVDELLRVFRAYLVKNLTGPRCADTSLAKEQQSRELQSIEYFNQDLRSRASGVSTVLPILVEETRPERTEGAAQEYRYWQTAPAKQLLSEYKKLRFTSKGELRGDAEKQESEWQLQLGEFLNALADWDTEESKYEVDHFHQKCVLYFGLLEILPRGHTRQHVVSSYVEFLGDSDVQRSSPVGWFLHVHNLINSMTSSEGEDRAVLVDALRTSSDPVLHLYGELEKALPQAHRSVR